MEITYGNASITIQGNTYPHRIFFRNDLSAEWHPQSKVWITQYISDTEKEEKLSNLQTYLQQNMYELKSSSDEGVMKYGVKRRKITIHCSYCGEEGHRISNCKQKKMNAWSKKDWSQYYDTMEGFSSALYQGKYCKCASVPYTNWDCKWRYYRRGFNANTPDSECRCQLSPFPVTCNFCEFACCSDCRTKKDAIGCNAVECPTHGIKYDTRGT